MKKGQPPFEFLDKDAVLTIRLSKELKLAFSKEAKRRKMKFGALLRLAMMRVLP